MKKSYKDDNYKNNSNKNNKNNNNKNSSNKNIIFFKIKSIAKHEILSNIKRKQFVIMTVLIPVILVAIALISAYFSSYATNQKIGYMDNFGISVPYNITKYNTVQQKNITLSFKKYNNIESGKNDVINGKINVFVIIPKDYLDNGTITVYSKSKSINPIITETLRDILLANILKGKVDNKTYIRVKSPLNLEIYSISKNGEEKENIYSQMLPIGFAMLLYLAITSVSGLSINSTIEEKQHRITELLLSFTNAENIIIGKILGISILGLMQMSIWLLFAIPMIIDYAINIPMILILSAIIFFILAYLFYVSLLCGIASLFTNPKDAGQIISPILMIQTIPLLLLSLIFTTPNHWIIKVLSYIPFTGPQVMLMRMSITHVELWEVLTSIIVMAICTVLSFVISVKLFRIGALIYDESFDLKKMIKIIKRH